MGRLEDIITFIEYDYSRGVVIEPEKRSQRLRDALFDVIKTYNPGVIIKAGMGSGRLLLEMAQGFKAYFVVVEPSMKVITEFTRLHADDPALERIHFINGEFNNFPVDYYAANLLVCIDSLEFLESGKVVDEFRRALSFDGILFIAEPVLKDDDIEGRYDDFMKEAFPLHNDFYLRDDLKTVLDLNEFKFIKGSIDYFKTDLSALAEYFAGLYSNNGGDPMAWLEDHRQEFSDLYGLDGTTISEPYYIGVFSRIKPDQKI